LSYGTSLRELRFCFRFMTIAPWGRVESNHLVLDA